MLQLRARVNQGAMAMKRYSTFPKAPALLEPHHQIVWHHIQDSYWGNLNPLQSVYSTAPTTWISNERVLNTYIATEVEPHIQMKFSFIPRMQKTLVFFPLCFILSKYKNSINIFNSIIWMLQIFLFFF